MPKQPTFPPLYDEVHTLTTTKCNEWGYFKPNQKFTSTIDWSRNEVKTSSMSAEINTLTDHPFIELSYSYREEKRKYKIQFVSIPSNLGKGLVWYFLCPVTYKRCRKLYLINGWLYHRDAFNGCMYDSQVMPKSIRWLKPYFQSEKLYEQLYKKHFKKFYAGKPTKKYLSLMKKIEKAERITHEDITSAMMR